MKKITGFLVLVALFVCMSTQVYGQKCKYEFKKVDDFTGEQSQRIKIRHHNMFNVMEFWQFHFNKIGKEYDITLITTLSYIVPVQVGDSIIIRIELDADGSGQFLTLYASEASSPRRAAIGNEVQAVEYGEYTFKCKVTEEQLKLLANSTAKIIRIPLRQNTDKKISEKEAAEIKKAASCIMQ